MNVDRKRALGIALVAVLSLPVAHLFAGRTALGALQPGAAQKIDLSEQLAAGKLSAVNRTVTKLDAKPGAVHMSEAADVGLAWIDGTDLAEGTIEVDGRGRDVLQQSYLRPFNFRAEDPTRHQHAVQYMMAPDYDWPRLRKEFPEEFENPVDASISPTDWVPLKVVVTAKAVQIFVGAVKTSTLEAKKLGQLDRGKVGLWVGNNSDGDFANLRVTPAK
jgi:hypothetical protein